MSIVLKVGEARGQWWVDHMKGLLPDQDVRFYQDPGNLDDVEIAVVWKPEPGWLKTLKNLRVIVSIGAGIDHILVDPELPKDIPIIRTTGDDLRVRMREYVTLHVLRHHRRIPEIHAAQKTREWLQIIEPPMYERGVGIMGLGNLGADCARALSALGFKTAGWSRSAKSIDGVECFHGEDGFRAFLARTNILVCLLPLTPSTHGIMNKDLFAALPENACVINSGRGEHLVDDDLIAALDSGHLRAATLDVFHQEPLQSDHPFWDHPKVLVTPHVASLIDPVAGGEIIAGNIRRFLAGEPVPDMVDVSRGY
ncbi:glyoxylate/hydroxypyruvate reductase A [Alphaproteobacteria bacterium HT1-32]|nr:glyoxylate/hydroxypyruvate reductase A [Alphaproteobacteria bacterium HT1-32]